MYVNIVKYGYNEYFYNELMFIVKLFFIFCDFKIRRKFDGYNK